MAPDNSDECKRNYSHNHEGLCIAPELKAVDDKDTENTEHKSLDHPLHCVVAIDQDHQWLSFKHSISQKYIILIAALLVDGFRDDTVLNQRQKILKYFELDYAILA
jgi:hypothetical protein